MEFYQRARSYGRKTAQPCRHPECDAVRFSRMATLDGDDWLCPDHS